MHTLACSPSGLLPGWRAHIRRAHKTWCEPDWHWINQPGREHGYLLWVVLKGEGSLVTASRTYRLFPGQCFIMRMEQPIEGRQDPRNRLLVPWLHYDYLDRRGRPRPAREVREQRVLEELGFIEGLLDRAIDAFLQGRSEEADRWLQAGLLEATRNDGRPGLSGPLLEQARRIERLCRMIVEEPGRRFPVEDMARHLFCTPDHFTRIFKRIKGISPREFITRSRMEQGKRLLRFSTHGVGRIARMLGYRDVYHFSRQFKLHAGVSPSLFRRRG